jgi:predicted O-methyltransferase YrrM
VRSAVSEATRVGFEFCVRPEIGRLLATCAAALPVGSLVAESGTGTGAGLAWMVSSSDPGVRLVSYERHTDRAAIAQEIFGHLANVEVVCGDASELFARGPFDLLVLDGGPGSGKTSGSAVVDPVEVLRPGGTMTIDDFTRRSAGTPRIRLGDSSATFPPARIRSRIGGQSTPHDEVRLLGLDRLPCPQHTLAAESAALGDPLRRVIVEVGEEMNSHDAVVSKRPPRHQIERLPCDPTATNATVEPVERFSPTRTEVELNADLTDAFVGWRERHGETSLTSRPPLQAAFHPQPRLLLRQRLGHHREARDVGVATRLGDRRRVSRLEQAELHEVPGQRRIGQHEIGHSNSVAGDTRRNDTGDERFIRRSRAFPRATRAMIAASELAPHDGTTQVGAPGSPYSSPIWSDPSQPE